MYRFKIIRKNFSVNRKKIITTHLYEHTINGDAVYIKICIAISELSHKLQYKYKKYQFEFSRFLVRVSIS